MRCLQSRLNRLIGDCVTLTKGNIGANRVAKQDHALRYQRKLLPIICQFKGFHGLTVELYLPSGRRIKAAKQLNQSGFSGPRAAHKRDHRTCRNMEADLI